MDCDILEKELSKLSKLNVGRPKKKLPTLLLPFVPKEVEDADIKHTILHQNNLIHLEDSIRNSLKGHLRNQSNRRSSQQNIQHGTIKLKHEKGIETHDI